MPIECSQQPERRPPIFHGQLTQGRDPAHLSSEVKPSGEVDQANRTFAVSLDDSARDELRAEPEPVPGVRNREEFVGEQPLLRRADSLAEVGLGQQLVAEIGH